MNKRLTTDSPQSATELMLNYAYAKEGRVVLRYGAGKENIDLCEYMAKATKDFCGDLTPEDYLEGACLECDTDCPFGILYTIATQAAELRARLKHYEENEEEIMNLDTNLYLDKRKFAEEITPAINHEMYKIDAAENNRGRGN